MAPPPGRSLDALAADWPAISRLLDVALPLPPAAQARWLAGLPEEHAALRGTLARLLQVRSAVETGDFLGTLPRLAQAAMAPEAADIGAAQPGDGVGPYRLVRELGEGGMGSVWLAERSDEQLTRPVALKLPRLAWARGLAERMARERDILATLEHPNIARLYDAGVDQLGRPWLALELVQGQPIDAYARDRVLTLRQRLKLLLQVCEAVAYAHSRLVIHRDLKPANVFVTEDGSVRLLDFGVAKLLHDPGGAAHGTLLTQLQGQPLTPAYASPEQLRGEPLTTASDVYSLGVLAYELLAGQRPPAPADGPPPLASRAAGDPALRRQLRSDLDAVLNRVLKTSLAERYASVAEFGDELRCVLDGLPVRALPDSLAYRLRKLVQRHRWPAASAAVALLALLGGLAATLWQSRVAQLQAHRAQTEAANARAVQGFMEDIFRANSADQRDPVAARATTAAQLLDRAVERVGGPWDVQPAVKLRLIDTLIALQRELGRHDEARQLAEQGVALARQAEGVSLGERLLVLSEAQHLSSRLADAVASARAAADALAREGRGDGSAQARLALRLGLLQRENAPGLDDGVNHMERAVALLRPWGPSRELSEALNAYADHLGGAGRAEESARHYEEALACCQTVPGTRMRLPEIHAGLARAREAVLDFDGFERHYRLAYDAAVALHEARPDVLQFAAADMVYMLNSVSRPLEALRWAEERPYIGGLERSAAPRSDNALYAMKHHAQALLAVGRLEDARRLNAAALDDAQRRQGRPATLRDLLEDAAGIALAQGRTADAALHLDRADEVARTNGLSRFPLNQRALAAQARLALQRGTLEQARNHAAALEPGPAGTGRHLRRLLRKLLLQAEIELAAGQPEQALQLVSRLQGEAGARPLFALQVARAQLVAGRAWLQMGRPGDALPPLRQAARTLGDRLDPALSPEAGAAAAALARALALRGERAEAARWLATAEGVRRRQVALPGDWLDALARARAAVSAPGARAAASA